MGLSVNRAGEIIWVAWLEIFRQLPLLICLFGLQKSSPNYSPPEIRNMLNFCLRT